MKIVSVKELVVNIKPSTPREPSQYLGRESQPRELCVQLIENLEELVSEIRQLQKKGYVLVHNPFLDDLILRKFPDEVKFRMEFEEKQTETTITKLNENTLNLSHELTIPDRRLENEVWLCDQVRHMDATQITENFGFSNPEKLLVNLRDNMDNPISVRTYNCLCNGGITYVGEFIQIPEQRILKIKNFGRRSLNEVKEILQGFGFSLPMVIPPEVIAWCKIHKPEFKYY